MTNAIPVNETPTERSARAQREFLAERASRRENNIADTEYFHENLTVAELIRVLQTLDQNAIVNVKDREDRWTNVHNYDISQVDCAEHKSACGQVIRPAQRIVFIGD